MAEFKTIPLAAIRIGERARPVNEESAQVIAASIAERGLINPITVRSTPAANHGETPYTLVAGGHRLRAAQINGQSEIEAIVVKADATEAQLLEISENLYRNELSMLDRALFVLKFREMWEEKNGKIGRGGDRRSKGNNYPLIFTGGRELSAQVQDRFGFGCETFKLVNRIGQNLHPSLRDAVRGTDAEDDQKLLLKLAKLPPSEQAGLAAALKFEPDVHKHLALDKASKPALNPDVKALEALRTAWKAAPEQVRQQFLAEISDNRLEVAA